MKISVVLPARNESKHLLPILRDISGLGGVIYKTIVVDDGSWDDTAKIAGQFPNTFVLRHKVNLGKGAALKTGCEAALKLGSDIVVLMDSDGQHLASDVPVFVKKLDKEHLDILFGVRKINNQMPLMMFLGNKFLTVTINLLFKVLVTDTQSGFKVLTRRAYEKIKWESAGYAVETEMIVKTGKNKLKYQELLIPTIYHDNYKGTTVSDGIKIFLNILKWRIIP